MTSLRAQYDQRTLSLINIFLGQGSHKLVSEAYLFAVCHLVYPLFQEEVDDTMPHADIVRIRPFYDVYEVSLKSVAAVANWLEQELEAGKMYGFAELEAFLKHGSNPMWLEMDRSALIRVLRYFHLQDAFNKAFWDAVMRGSHLPQEVQHIVHPFEPKTDLPIPYPKH